MKSLVIYYSRRGENFVNGGVCMLERGNAEIIAGFVRDAVDADIFHIETVRTYSPKYLTCIEEAKAELRLRARPELKEYLTDISEYDNIFIVAPNWWGIYPMAIYSQLERLDFTDKTVHYIVVHEGSGLGGVPKTLQTSCKGARFGYSLAILGGTAPQSQLKVFRWAVNAIS